METLLDRRDTPAAAAAASAQRSALPLLGRGPGEREPVSGHLIAAVLGTTSICVGLLWDISWHASIGRDTFWTPAHLALYLGGLLCGLSAGWEALAATFTGTARRRAATVGFWGFRAPLGAWVAIWGTFAMLTSAPFDDWWHSAYGLDVRIISPPHILLAAGILAVQLGAMLQALAVQNRTSQPTPAVTGAPGTAGIAGMAGTVATRLPALVYAWAAGSLVAIVMTLFLEYSAPNMQHGALFYKISCAVLPVLLVAAACAARLRWPATTVAGCAMAVRLIMTWVLPLFPATPRLAPIYNPIHHMWPLFFPPLVIVPAIAIDLLLQRRLRLPANRTVLALLLGVVFFACYVAAQWQFAAFLLGPHARNWFFAGDEWTYHTRLGPWRHQFRGLGDPLSPAAAAVCVLLAAISARVGLAWGGWMARVRR
jgi:hypothetical protein